MLRQRFSRQKINSSQIKVCRFHWTPSFTVQAIADYFLDFPLFKKDNYILLRRGYTVKYFFQTILRNTV